MTTTSATVLPRPDSKPASARTTDASGFVDNTGQSGTERARPQTSGMRATEAGGDVPTGTPASGLPLPIEVRPPRAESAERPRSRQGPRVQERANPAGAPSDAVVGRAVEALCDREMVCDHIGANKPFPTAATCMDSLRPQVREDLDSAGCIDGFDAPAVAACLTAARRPACDVKVDGLASIAPCDPPTLCLKL